MTDALKQKIKKALSDIPASNPGVMSFYPTTLRQILSDELLEKIAEVAAKTVEDQP